MLVSQQQTLVVPNIECFFQVKIRSDKAVLKPLFHETSDADSRPYMRNDDCL